MVAVFRTCGGAGGHLSTTNVRSDIFRTGTVVHRVAKLSGGRVLAGCVGALATFRRGGLATVLERHRVHCPLRCVVNR